MVNVISRDLLVGLRKRGFQLNFGYLGTGSRLLAWSKRGGYYLGKDLFPHRYYDTNTNINKILVGASSS